MTKMLEHVTLKQLLAGGGGVGFGLLFAYQMAAGQTEARGAMERMQVQHSEIVAAASETKELAGRSYMANERVLFVLRVMCVNQAQTAEARRLCLAENDGLGAR